MLILRYHHRKLYNPSVVLDFMKHIVVTGSSSGFGKLIVEGAAAQGHVVYACMREINGKNKAVAQALTEWAHAHGHQVHVIEMDVTHDSSVEQAVRQILEGGPIDVVVNNAGIGNFGLTEGYDSKKLEQIFSINVFGPLRVNNAVLPHMRAHKSGLIIQISSMLGRTVIPMMSVYSGTKWGIEAIIEGQHHELKGLGIDSVIVQPGGYPTGFTNNILAPSRDLSSEYGAFPQKMGEAMQEFMESLKAPGAPNPQEVADAVLHLIAMPHGSRPLRTPVGATVEGVNAINHVAAQVQDQMLKNFGIT